MAFFKVKNYDGEKGYVQETIDGKLEEISCTGGEVEGIAYLYVDHDGADRLFRVTRDYLPDEDRALVTEITNRDRVCRIVEILRDMK